MTLPDLALLQALFTYEPSTGVFTWASLPHVRTNVGLIGREAGALNSRGYRVICVAKRKYFAHRLAWKLVHGSDPQGEIDHINGDRSDNRICNLRVVSRVENGRNLALPTHNRSGSIGVAFRADRRKWMAYIRVNKRNRFLGNFAKKQDAIAARKRAEREFSFHENHGRLSISALEPRA